MTTVNENINSRPRPTQQRHAGLVDRLLGTPIGRLSPVLWQEATEAIKDEPTHFLIILDRLLDEVNMVSQNVNNVSRFPPIEAIKLTPPLHHWRNRVTVSTGAGPSLCCPSPAYVWNKLKHYAQNKVVCLHGITYSVVIDAIGKTGDHASGSGGGGGGEEAAEAVVRDAIQLAREFPSTCQHPNTSTISSLIQIWAKSGRPEAPDKAQGYWETLLEWSRTRDDCHPSSYTYSAMIEVWASSQRPEALDKMEEFIGIMESQQGRTSNKMAAYAVVVKGLAKSGHASRAHEQLLYMIQRHQEEDPELNLDEKFYFSITIATVLDAYRQLGNVEAMAALIEQMEALSEQHKTSEYLPDTVGYSMLIDAYACRGLVEQADKVLQHTIRMARTINPRATPDEISWDTVLQGWSKSGDPGAAARMKAILVSMAEFKQASVDCYNTLLRYYSNQASHDGLVQAEELLWGMMNKGVVNLVSYHTVLRAWEKAGHPERAHALLEKLTLAPLIDKVYGPDLLTDEAPKNGEGASTKNPNKLGDESAFVRPGDPPRPNVASLNIVLAAWLHSRRPDGADRTLDLIEFMKKSGVRPNERSYCLTIGILAHQGRLDQAHHWLTEMDSQFESGATNMIPDMATCRTLLLACARAGDPHLALAMVGRMTREYMAGRYESPTTKDFNFVLEAWSNSQHTDAWDKIQRGLGSMRTTSSGGASHPGSPQLLVPPDLYSYAIALSALLSDTNMPRTAHHRNHRSRDGHEDNDDRTAATRISRLLQEMDQVDTKVWKGQGKAVFVRIRHELSKSRLSQKGHLLRHLRALMERHQISES